MTRSVMVVDDSEFQRNLVKKTINNWFNIVGEAENGEEAIDVFEEKDPDVITMDIMMPKMNGIEALKTIKKESPNTIIVMVTSVTQREKMKEAAKNGADGYVTKAFEKEDLKSEFNDIFEVNVGE